MGHGAFLRNAGIPQRAREDARRAVRCVAKGALFGAELSGRQTSPPAAISNLASFRFSVYNGWDSNAPVESARAIEARVFEGMRRRAGM